MPSKVAPKPKVEPAKQSPAKPSTPRKPSTPKTPKEPPVFTALKSKQAAPIPITIRFEGESPQSKLVKNGSYGQTLKLDAPNPFSAVTTIIIQEGEYAGHQAVVLKPAKPFEFMKLPKEARQRIYAVYFAPNGVKHGDIVLEGRDSKKDVYAKAYSEGEKYRVALLRVSKEVRAEATPVFYNHNLRLENTSTLLDFLTQSVQSTKERLTKITAKTFVKTTARQALHLLSASPNVTFLHFDLGVASGDDTAKAAKDFYNDAYKFLEAVGVQKKDKKAGVDVLSFGREAFKRKVDNKAKEKGAKPKPWEEDLVEEFRENLKAKLK